jgi:hypothetical protein
VWPWFVTWAFLATLLVQGFFIRKGIKKEIAMTAQATLDLQAALAGISTSIGTAIADLQELAGEVAAGNSINPADIEAVVTALNGQKASLDAANAAAVPPAPPAGTPPASA